jgi:hypothetical protein
MIAKISEQSFSSNNGLMSEKMLVDIPKADMVFFKLFADKFNWHYDSRQNLWETYVKSSPQNVNLSDNEIMEMISTMRYAKA